MLELNKIYNMDCLIGMKDIPDNSIDMVFTDPPYGNNNNNGDLIAMWEVALGRRKDYIPERDDRPIMNDGAEADEIFKQAIVEYNRILKPGACCCCCCCGGGPNTIFARWCLYLDEIMEFKQMIIWDKGPMGMGWHYRRSYETIMVAMKKGAACKWHDNSDKIENIIRPNYKRIRKIIPQKWQHPTQKPVELVEHFINLHTQEGEIVLDPFMGSGTTAEAAYNQRRNFIGFELDPKYYEMSCKRINDVMSQGKLF